MKKNLLVIFLILVVVLLFGLICNVVLQIQNEKLFEEDAEKDSSEDVSQKVEDDGLNEDIPSVSEPTENKQVLLLSKSELNKCMIPFYDGDSICGYWFGFTCSELKENAWYSISFNVSEEGKREQQEYFHEVVHGSSYRIKIDVSYESGSNISNFYTSLSDFYTEPIYFMSAGEDDVFVFLPFEVNIVDQAEATEVALKILETFSEVEIREL